MVNMAVCGALFGAVAEMVSCNEPFGAFCAAPIAMLPLSADDEILIG
jgi:hypothetical protein